MQTLYPAMSNSPLTSLAAAITAIQTTIDVVDGSKLPAAPNLATIGNGESAETILYTSKSGNALSGVTRGLQGTSQAWSSGIQIGRFFTAYDHDAFIEHMNARPIMSTQDSTFYVDSTIGNDSNDGKTAATPFKTIAMAVSKIPQIANHTFTIAIAAGTYNEDVTLQGFYGKGLILINGSSTADNSRSIKSITKNNCGVPVITTGLYATKADGIGFTANRCVHAVFAKCKIDVAASQNGISLFASNGIIQNCSISNRSNAITATISTVSSDTNTGSGNSVGLYAAQGATIGKSGTQPSATAAEQVYGGGQIR
ncbi:hypothetical protein [Aneurinibacillus sp. REN35]|uniref:hypothetical protein n=1 Tax=Aneurinibacillus sp. REN35 TaxID=3237286 RepID=UPI0035298698